MMVSLTNVGQYFGKFQNTLKMPPLVLMASVMLYVLLFDNKTFWRIALEVFGGDILALSGIIGALYFLNLAVFCIFSIPQLVKPFCVIVLMLSSVTSYYMDNLGVFIDREMIQNVMVTTVTESKHLITIGFLLHVATYGLLPSILVLMVKLKKYSAVVTFGVPVFASIICFGVCIALLAIDFKTYASVVRDRRDLMASYQPGAPIVNSFRYAAMVGRTINAEVQPLGEDAIKGVNYFKEDKAILTVLVVGETARAQNFSLNGYDRETNPMLSRWPILNFENVSSCGTSTAVSLPCMFSSLSRKQYSFEAGIAQQNLLDVLKYAGFEVEWWENNTGHKGIANRVKSRDFAGITAPNFCRKGECDDGIFLPALRTYAESITKDTVVVLHQIGSHGPAYHLRYPPASERFTPACKEADFQQCSTEEIVNAYDNTIAYTDKVLSEIIGFLNAQDDLTTALVYVSDHGESLGEGGLYLHGAPYFLAPEYQTKVPMIVWLSDAYKKQFALDSLCLASQSKAELSHDNFFHSVLGLLNISTMVRNEDLDIFAKCRT
ncbi:phosphoethanolamine--lipid A transferase [Lentibacter sp.]|jgi:lipid A ethanolaminephosphotransferase|uniref:phosphoethanolamine transferase n=1 Tax=Lentibacter sp. TaxID=2024994 RepID=UPI0032D8CD56